MSFSIGLLEASAFARSACSCSRPLLSSILWRLCKTLTSCFEPPPGGHTSSCAVSTSQTCIMSQRPSSRYFSRRKSQLYVGIQNIAEPYSIVLNIARCHQGRQIYIPVTITKGYSFFKGPDLSEALKSTTRANRWRNRPFDHKLTMYFLLFESLNLTYWIPSIYCGGRKSKCMLLV